MQKEENEIQKIKNRFYLYRFIGAMLAPTYERRQNKKPKPLK